MKRRVVFLVVALVSIAATSEAAVTNVTGLHVPQSVLPDYIVTDIVIDFEGNLRGQQMILNLTAGSIYQDGLGSNLPSNSGFWGPAPTLRYDTYVAIGGRQSNGPKPPATQSVLIVGGAANLEPGAQLKFDTGALNVAWAPGTGVDIPSGQDFITARITLSNDARGTLQYFGSTAAGTGDPFITSIDFCNGGTSTDCGSPPVVEDKSVEYTAMFPSTLVSENLNFSGASPFFEEWSLESFDSPNGKPAMVDPDTGLFTWDGYGSPEGVYEAVIRFSNDVGSDTGTLSITWRVPEPGTVGLLSCALPTIVLRLRRRLPAN